MRPSCWKRWAEAVPSLVAMLQARDSVGPADRPRTLQQLGPDAKTAVPALVQRLWDPDTSVRQAVVLALRDIGPEAKVAIPALAQRLRDPDRYVAVDAAHTLGRMGPDSTPSLVPLLRDCNPRVRELALQTFRQIGTEALPVGQAFQPDGDADKVRLESLTYA